tara:strand:+ start:871 stop:1074 length:204 start_codon:yes stop_codon:yes gene_type:complete
MSNYIKLTPKTFRELKIAYQRAVLRKEEFFEYNGNKWDTQYAKIIIEHMENQSKRQRFTLTPKYRNN